MVDDLRRITTTYAKKIGGLPIISILARRKYEKMDHPQLEDSVLVEDLEELVEAALQEVDQPLYQLEPDSPYCSPFQNPIQYQLHTPLIIMENVNANQPPPQLAWRARSPLNLPPPLHDLPQTFEKIVVGISPFLQSRKNYLPSIGWKDRVPGGCARKTK